MRNRAELFAPVRPPVGAPMSRISRWGGSIGLLILLAASGCSSSDDEAPPPDQESAAPAQADPSSDEASVTRPTDKLVQRQASANLYFITTAGLPQVYGLYAFDNGKVQRLDGNEAWERESWSMRSDFSPAVRFIVFDRGLSNTLTTSTAGGPQLASVAAVRNEVKWSTGAVQPLAKKYEWVVPGLASLQTPVVIRPVPDHPDMFFVDPGRPLAPGLYELAMPRNGAPLKARVGVEWSRTNRDDYAQTHCVDRVVGSQVSYAECGTAASGTVAAPGSGG